MMKKLFFMLIVAFACAGTADAQGWLKKLGKVAEDAAKRTVERKVEQKTEQAVDDAVEGKMSSKKDKKSKDSDDADYEDAEVTEQSGDDTPVDAKNQKSDFVRGSVVMFEDDLAGEQIGEFPSKWDLVRGSAEVASINGAKCIEMDQRDSWIAPLVKGGIKNYLGDVFTIEYDMLYDDRKKDGCASIELDIMHEKSPRDNELFTITYNTCHDKQAYDCSYCLTSEPSFNSKDGHATSAETTTNNDGRWHHFALSFNKRAIKFYVDGKRQINVPNAKPGAGWVTWFASGGTSPVYIKNVVIAKGAVDLYERNATDIDAKVAAVEKAIAETGKFVTNNILFETGKATLKPESMEEIQKVAEYMKKNPTARFEVQGHTDNQGSDKINDPLSQQRAEAVVKALEGLGCDPFNMRAVGKGSHEPVADNKTDEGRAKNRRVEFIKK
jgi:outer membrane protein OmpA-like peptidoglycan-associated protein